MVISAQLAQLVLHGCPPGTIGFIWLPIWHNWFYLAAHLAQLVLSGCPQAQASETTDLSDASKVSSTWASGMGIYPDYLV